MSLKKEAWTIAEKCLKKLDYRSHGLGHAKKVYKHFQLLKNNVKSIKINKKIMESLEYAVILHDIGNRDKRDGHGIKSVKILQKEFPNFYSRLPNKEWIKYAIENHSSGAKKNPKTPKELCLAYLILLDNMDGIGIEGKNRIARYLMKEFKKSFIIVPKNRNNSVFEDLLLNHGWASENINRVKGNISKNFNNKYEKLKKENEKVILELVKKELKKP